MGLAVLVVRREWLGLVCITNDFQTRWDREKCNLKNVGGLVLRGDGVLRKFFYCLKAVGSRVESRPTYL